MNAFTSEYRISRWLAEFADPEMEESYQKHFQHLVNRQLRTILIFWIVLNLLFALPDYEAMGVSREFMHLLIYRVILSVILVLIFINIKPDTNLFRLSYAIAGAAVFGFSGFMMFFFYRPDVINWIVGVIMLMIVGLLMLFPIRFYLSFLAALFGVGITLLTRFLMGSPLHNLLGLFFLLILPFFIGVATTRRLAFLQRKQFALAARTAKINSELENEIQQRLKLETTLKELAATDPLTGLYNRREYEILFTHEIERAKRMNTALSIGIVDLDHFKKVNDTYGHGVGDDVLRRTANLCRENLRTMDIIGRLGGEEFVILLPETTIENASVIGKRLCETLAAANMDNGNGTIKITATIGISQLLPDDPDFNAIIHRADAALYRGKAAGRNRVEVNLI